MSLDGNELDMRAYIERRRKAVDECLAISRAYLAEARSWHSASPCDDSRTCLVLSMAAVEVGEAERDALDVEFP